MPEGLQDLASVVVGADFPEGDEDALRRLGDAWAACAAEVDEVLGDTEAAVKDVLSTMEGATADAFKTFASELTASDAPDAASLQKLQEVCEQLGQGCDDLALEVEYSKSSIIAALVVLFAQIALMLAMAAWTFGASSAGIPAAQAATQAVVRGLMEALKQAVLKIAQEVLKQLAIQIPANMAANLLVDASIQLDQMREGNREEWDGDKTGAAALTGLGNGIGAGVTGGALSGATRGLTDKLGDKLGDKFGDSIGGKVQWGGSLLGGAGVGAAGGAAGASIGAGMNQDEQSEQGLGAGAFGGTVGGAGGAGKGFKTSLDDYSSHPTWQDWDGEPPKTTDVTELVGPGQSRWQDWDGEPPKTTDVTELVGPADKPEPPPREHTDNDGSGETPTGGSHAPASDKLEKLIPGEVPMPGPLPPSDVELEGNDK